jgi:hypothetical protein
MTPRLPLPARFALACFAVACFALGCFALGVGDLSPARAQPGGTPDRTASSAPTSPGTSTALAPISPELSPAEAQRALTVVQDPRQRAQLIETLRTIARAAVSSRPA